MYANFEPVVETAKDIVEQNRRFYFSTEYSEESYYAALPDEYYPYAKEYARRSYANGWNHYYAENFMWNEELETVGHVQLYMYL